MTCMSPNEQLLLPSLVEQRANVLAMLPCSDIRHGSVQLLRKVCYILVLLFGTAPALQVLVVF